MSFHEESNGQSKVQAINVQPRCIQLRPQPLRQPAPLQFDNRQNCLSTGLTGKSENVTVTVAILFRPEDK